MTLKKHKSTDESATQETGDQTIHPSENSVDMSANSIDSNEPVVTATETQQVDIEKLIAEATAKVKQQEQEAQQRIAMGAVPLEEYNKPQPGVTHIPSSDKKAYTGPMSPKQKDELIERLKARTATKEDLAHIDESMILDLPFIKASDFSIPGQYDPKPKDPSIRFRWVNCVNALQSNMQRFLALGFTPATPDDVNQDKTPLADSMIQGTQIKQYDVILMKINVLKLMSLYKKNIQDSAYKLDAATSGDLGRAAAGQAFEDLLGSDPDAMQTGARGALNKYRVASGREPVTFSRT
jgi:hypothetical protein